MLWGNNKFVAVIGGQFGDEAKGKFVDILAENADVVARGTGGTNAGHTVVVGDKKIVLHLLHSGILQDKRGLVGILGKGMVIDPLALVREMDELTKLGVTYDNIQVSNHAHVTLPFQKAFDAIKNKSQENGGIGSTGSGIGPTYADKAHRFSPQICDLFDTDALRGKVEVLAKMYLPLLRRDDLKLSTLVDETMDAILPTTDRIRQFVRDTDLTIRKYIQQNKRIVAEGANGTLLGIDHGFYPYETSSDCSVHGLATGIGVNVTEIDRTLLVVKCPIMTRVGAGPFPSEMGGQQSERHCADVSHTLEWELNQHGIPHTGTTAEKNIKYDKAHPTIVALQQNKDSFLQGVGMRLATGQYGATTGRPRRVGWIDLPLLKYAMKVNGTRDVVLTTLDAADTLDALKLCHAHRYDGPDAPLGYPELKKGQEITHAIMDRNIASHCTPCYTVIPGWQTKTTDIRSPKDAPRELVNVLDAVTKETGANIRAISVGPNRDQAIYFDK